MSRALVLPMPPPDDVTHLLQLVNDATPGAEARLIDAVYGELRRMARGRMAREGQGHTLQPTALVHDAYMRLTGNTSGQWQNRRHFFRAASEAMRRVLIDHARSRDAQKRGGKRVDQTPDLVEFVHVPESVDLLALGEALEELAREDERAAEVARLRYLLGFTLDETAEALEVTARTVTSDWQFAKAWLTQRLDG